MEVKGAAAGLAMLFVFVLFNGTATEAPAGPALPEVPAPFVLPDVNALPRPAGETFRIRPSLPPRPVDRARPWDCRDLPFPMAGYAQPVAADGVYVNAVYLWRHRELACAPRTARALVHLIEQSSELRGGARYFLYNFEHTAFGHTVQPPWVSGFAQGQLLSALSLLFDAFREERFAKLAAQVYATFKDERVIRRVAGYYWIEEFPLAGRHTLILNGHISGVVGIYDYLDKVAPGEDPALLYQGIETAKAFTPLFRRVGMINCYDLIVCFPDYEPTRAVYQQELLYAMTGDAAFKRNAEELASDLRARELRRAKRLARVP